VACLVTAVRLDDDGEARFARHVDDIVLTAPPGAVVMESRPLRAPRSIAVPPTLPTHIDFAVPQTAAPWFAATSVVPPDTPPPPIEENSTTFAIESAAPLRQLPTDTPSLRLPVAIRTSVGTASVPAHAAPDAVMRSLYVGFGVLQGLDVYTTRVALQSGAREANPLMVGLADRPAALVAAKAAAAFGTVYLVERLRVRNGVAAVVTMAAIDSAYAMLVVRNARVAGGLRERLR
jgi:hypothetical protein